MRKWTSGNSVLDVGCEFGILATMLPATIKCVGVNDDLGSLELAEDIVTKTESEMLNFFI